MLRHTVRAFHSVTSIASIRIVARREDFEALASAFADREHWQRLGPWIEGGTERQDSVRLGLAGLAGDPAGVPDWVLVHDGARPLCTAALIQRVLAALEHHPAVVPVLPVFDTVRHARASTGVHPADQSAGVVDRAELRLCQTPQGFHWDTLWQAHTRAAADGFTGTDDGQLVERLGGKVALVPGERRNLKVTLPDDLALAEWAWAHPAWGMHRLK
jgi:2-C-methyl-D-erythritol 4-phosphate cytidylyltransferase